VGVGGIRAIVGTPVVLIVGDDGVGDVDILHLAKWSLAAVVKPFADLDGVLVRRWD
jgi:hypothetical protein